MSRQIGLIKIKGNLDGVSFYQSDGENFVRMAKGPTKQRILTDPAFKRTRENNREFTGCAKAARGLRRALIPVIKMADRRLVARTLKLCKEVNVKGKGLRGQRTVEISQNRDKLVNLELNNARIFESVFKAPKEVSHSDARNSALINIPSFSTDEMVTSFPGATHFRVVNLIGVVSDYGYNAQTNSYEPLEPKLEGLFATAFSDYLSVDGVAPAINLPVALPGAPVLTPAVSVIQGIGIQFYQEVDGNFVSLKQTDSFRIIGAF